MEGSSDDEATGVAQGMDAMSTRAITMFAHLRSTQPISREVQIEAIAHRLGRFADCASREERSKRVALWSPVTYRPGTTRASRNVADVQWLVLDYDDGTPAKVARERWSRWIHIGHTTFSHMQERSNGNAPAPALRVVLPLARPVAAEVWPDVMRQVLSTFGTEADKKCIDPARMFYVPVAKPGAARAHWIHLPRDRFAGPLLNLDRVVERARQAVAEREAQASRRRAEVEQRRASMVRSNRDRDREVRRLLLEDGSARRQIGETLGGHEVDRQSGSIVRGIVCPACSRPSVWFFVEPSQLRRAKCNHANSCGYTGHLWELASLHGYTF